MIAQNLSELFSKHLGMGSFPVDFTALTTFKKNVNIEEDKLRYGIFQLPFI